MLREDPDGQDVIAPLTFTYCKGQDSRVCVANLVHCPQVYELDLREAESVSDFRCKD